ncbi:hypothetical protein, partial [Brucella melitensis]|uniref:hypothetical protein n=1 Tax=Brucella melitensis TaxID=29459 RepID=UPI001FD5670D
QALVAGLDYEVEQKTYPARFVSLAESSGFSLLQHRRIYATQGKAQAAQNGARRIVAETVLGGYCPSKHQRRSPQPS